MASRLRIIRVNLAVLVVAASAVIGSLLLPGAPGRAATKEGRSAASSATGARPDLAAADARAVAAAATPDDGGMWVAWSNGAVTTTGDARSFGDASTLHLAAPITGMAVTPDGGGYWLLGADGGVFSFGDATFHGSTGGMHLAAPVKAIVPTPDAAGYWLLASDGGVFSYGDAGFFGSASGATDGNQAVALIPSHAGDGYWIVLSDGAVLPYGKAGQPTTQQVSGSATPGYAFEVVDSSGRPARWNPCDPISYAVITPGAPSGWQSDVADDIAQANAATGLTFTDAGSFASASDVPSGVDLTIGWVPSLTSADPLGLTNYWYHEAAGYAPQMMSAQIELLQGLQAGGGTGGEQPVLLHELGHALGLAQAAGGEVMNPADEGYTSFQSGDLAGLAQLGSAQGCQNFYS